MTDDPFEQLGSDNLDVRIGGIYALERIARDSATDHPIVMEKLTAFIREHSRGPGAEAPERATRPDIQAAFTVVGRRNAEHDIPGQPIDLTGAVLDRAYLADAKLGGAVLTHANLPRADMTRADLTGAVLTRAYLAAAKLGGAVLDRADLSGADLTDVVLGGAVLTRANLTGAVLTRAYLTGAVLDRAVLDGANLDDATLTDVRWPEGVRVPDGWMVDSDSGRLKRAGQLSEVMTHYL